MAEHDLKVWPKQFTALAQGKKTFEFRRNDRDYRVGDTLLLREYDPTAKRDSKGTPIGGEYTGRKMRCHVPYILDSGFGLPHGYVVMSIITMAYFERGTGEP